MSKTMIKVSVPMTGEEEAEAVREVILSGRYVSGPRVAEFEKQFAAYLDSAHGCAVNSGTAAQHVALAVLGIGPGDEVIVPPLTFMSTVTAVLHQNAIPVFADIDPDTLCLSAADVEKRITPRTKAIVPVHFLGNAADMDPLMALAEKHGLYVLEDCAQAHGTEYKGRRVGSIGHMGFFSFYATKHMTTGEGGMLTSNNEEWIQTARRIRSHGMVGRDDHVHLGYNYRMNEMAGAMGLVQIKKLEQYNEQRIKNSLYLLDELKKHSDTWFKVPPLSPDVRHTFFWCPLQVRLDRGFDTAEVVAKLRERGVEVRQRYQEPLYKQPIFQTMSPYPGSCPFCCQPPENVPNYASLRLPGAEAAAGSMIGLPNHPKLSQAELDTVLETVLTLYTS